MIYYGEFGGRVLRAFKADKPFIVGAEISAEEAEKWPLANRKALYNAHKVEWYGPPVTQRPAPVKKAAASDEEKEKKEEKTPPVKSSRRTSKSSKRGK